MNSLKTESTCHCVLFESVVKDGLEAVDDAKSGWKPLRNFLLLPGLNKSAENHMLVFITVMGLIE